MEIYQVGLWSLFINILIKAFYSALHSVIFVNVAFNDSVKIVIYVISAAILPFIIIKILNSHFFRDILNWIGKKTINKNIFEDIIDHEKRTMMIIYPKDADVYYIGACKLREENGVDSYIALIEYAIFDKLSQEPIRDSKELGLKASMLFNLRDIEHIELVYEDDSKVWKWLNENN